MVDLLKHANNLYFLVLLIYTFSKTSLSTRILNPYVIKKWKEYKRNLTLEQEENLIRIMPLYSLFLCPSIKSFFYSPKGSLISFKYL